MNIDVPPQLDLSALQGTGLQPHEHELPAGGPAQPAPSAPLVNEADVEMMVSMDIPRVRAERALFATGNNGVETAMGWLFEHLDDPGMSKEVYIKS